jgi:AAA+ ATPase superfamily predicted ATPase
LTIFEKFATEYKEPLYGRMNGQILLKPLAPIVEAEIFSDLDLFTPANWLRFHFL